MRFIIQDGMPYLISGGRAFPVDITDKKEVIIDRENGFETDKIGCLMLDEVIAKIGYTKKQEPAQEEKKPRKKADKE